MGYARRGAGAVSTLVFTAIVAGMLACGDDSTAGADAGARDATVPDGGILGTVDGGMETPGRLIWFGPHPDDELYVAPILGHYCVESGWQCTMVVFTRGEGGGCNLPEGCVPNLTTVRTRELEASAAMLGAELDLWDLGDNGRYEAYAGDVQDVLEAWAARAGSVEALVSDVTDAIVARDPTLVLAVDPRHGNYCHPTHRAAGAIVAQAILDMGATAPRLQMVAGRTATAADRAVGFVPVVPRDPTITFFDATVPSDTLGGEAWDYFIAVLRTHPSQFTLTDSDVANLRDAEAINKRVFLVDIADIVPDDPLYDDLCPPSTFLE